jgi:hypothetical protein
LMAVTRASPITRWWSPGGWRRGNSIVSRIKNRPTSSRSHPVQPPSKVQSSAAAQSCGWLSPRRPFVDPRPAARRHRIVNRNGAIADGEAARRDAIHDADAKPPLVQRQENRGCGRPNLRQVALEFTRGSSRRVSSPKSPSNGQASFRTPYGGGASVTGVKRDVAPRCGFRRRGCLRG